MTIKELGINTLLALFLWVVFYSIIITLKHFLGI